MAARQASSLMAPSERMTVCPLKWEDVTFFTGRAFQTASLMWLSHMPHIMPPIFRSISYTGMTSLEWNFASPGFRG